MVVVGALDPRTVLWHGNAKVGAGQLGVTMDHVTKMQRILSMLREVSDLVAELSSNGSALTYEQLDVATRLEELRAEIEEEII